MINPDSFFARIRAGLFHDMSQGQVDGCNAIIGAWVKWQPDADLRYVAYALATAYRETAATMQPIAEYGHGQGHDYGVGCGPYGKIYYGRGLVQLTWVTNYRNATEKLQAKGVLDAASDLVRDPELALRADIASEILVFGMIEGWFTGRKLGDYFSAASDDPVNARRIINGLDHADEIAGYHQIFLTALSA